MLNNNILNLITVHFILFIASLLHAQEMPIQIDSSSEYKSLGKSIEIYEDKTGTLTIGDILGQNASHYFSKSDLRNHTPLLQRYDYCAPEVKPA